MPILEKNNFSEIVQKLETNFSKKVAIACDWLEFFGDGYFPIPQKTTKEVVTLETFTLNDNIFLQYCGHGTSLYQSLFKVYVHGEHFAMAQAHPRFIKGQFVESTFGLKIENHMLYTDYWNTYLEDFLYTLDLKIENVTRLDVCIDGLQGVLETLNFYHSQGAQEKFLNRMGKSGLNGYEFKDSTGKFDKFSIGSSKSDKVCAFYCKTREIEVSNKTYILAYWKRQKMDIVENVPVYRLEMRMRSAFLKGLKDFDYLQLHDSTYLASIFRTAANNFFHFKTGTAKNKSEQCDLPIVPYTKLGGKLLTKLKKPESQDRYKAKLTIHLFSKLIIIGKIEKKKVESTMIDQIMFLIDLYELDRWYSKKIEQWRKDYEPQKIKIVK